MSLCYLNLGWTACHQISHLYLNLVNVACGTCHILSNVNLNNWMQMRMPILSNVNLFLFFRSVVKWNWLNLNANCFHPVIWLNLNGNCESGCLSEGLNANVIELRMQMWSQCKLLLCFYCFQDLNLKLLNLLVVGCLQQRVIFFYSSFCFDRVIPQL